MCCSSNAASLLRGARWRFHKPAHMRMRPILVQSVAGSEQKIANSDMVDHDSERHLRKIARSGCLPRH
jgi:hypothetical protein